jgi:hypothetical protein
MQNIFHICTSATPWFTSIHHIWTLMTSLSSPPPFSQISQRNECPAFGMPSLQIPLTIHIFSGCTYGLVLQTLTLYQSVCWFEELFLVCHVLVVISSLLFHLIPLHVSLLAFTNLRLMGCSVLPHVNATCHFPHTETQLNCFFLLASQQKFCTSYSCRKVQSTCKRRDIDVWKM